VISMFNKVPDYRDLRRRRIPPPGVVVAPLAARERFVRAGGGRSGLAYSAARPPSSERLLPNRTEVLPAAVLLYEDVLSASEFAIAYVKRTGQFILSHSADRSLKTMWCFVLACSLGHVDPRPLPCRRRSRSRR